MSVDNNPNAVSGLSCCSSPLCNCHHNYNLIWHFLDVILLYKFVNLLIPVNLINTHKHKLVS